MGRGEYGSPQQKQSPPNRYLCRIDIFKAYRLTDHVQSGKPIARDQDTSPDMVLWQPKSSPLELILRDPVGPRWDFLGHAPGAKKKSKFCSLRPSFFDEIP